MEIHAPLEARNSYEAPDTVRVTSAELPLLRGETLEGDVNPYSLTLWSIGRKDKDKGGRDEQE
jgi:hypothetical protein